MHFKYYSESAQNELGNIFGYGEHGKLREAFKYYWMNDETQFCIVYTLIISLSCSDIEDLVVPDARGKKISHH
jgi:hypothetical protein